MRFIDKIPTRQGIRRIIRVRKPVIHPIFHKKLISIPGMPEKILYGSGFGLLCRRIYSF